MNKFFKSILAFSCAAVVALGAASCSSDVVKLGSKIKECTVTIGYTDAETQQKVTRDINFELYLNFTPGTIEHFEYLASKGYYDGTTVSNVSPYAEFGGYYYKDGVLKSKYDSDAEKGYFSFITKEYSLNKYIGANKNVQRYAEDLSINGEFANNGIGGNKLSLTTGALVLKHDYSYDKNTSVINTGKATMAVVFSAGSYFDAAENYAILGKIVQDDEDKFEDEKSSYTFFKDLVENSSKDSDDNTYWYYDNKNTEYAEVFETIGRYFMRDENGKLFTKDANGKFTVDIEADDTYKDALVEIGKNSNYYLQLPATQITIEGITFGK